MPADAALTVSYGRAMYVTAPVRSSPRFWSTHEVLDCLEAELEPPPAPPPPMLPRPSA